MPCLSHLSKLKHRARSVIDQTYAIKQCLVCNDILKEIEAHHQDINGLKSAVLEINKCPECNPKLKGIIACAKMGHIHA